MIRRILAIIAGLGVAACLLIAGPQRITLDDAHTGDTALADSLEKNAPRGAHQLAAFTLNDSRPTFAGLGADEHTQVEIGSLSKMFNAELLRQAVESGDVSLGTTVGDIIDADGELASVTLGELVNHTSGLPRIAGTNPAAGIIETNPYDGISPEKIFELAQDAKITNRGERNYSNLGAALLGQLLAKKEGVAWKELVARNVFQPAGMTETLAASPGAVGDGPTGFNGKGRPAAAWDMDGYAPAGGIRSTASDMAKFTTFVLDKNDFDNGWIRDGDTVWHNGGTGGYSTMLVINPDNKTASYVSNDTAASVDKLGKDLMEGI